MSNDDLLSFHVAQYFYLLLSFVASCFQLNLNQYERFSVTTPFSLSLWNGNSQRSILFATDPDDEVVQLFRKDATLCRWHTISHGWSVEIGIEFRWIDDFHSNSGTCANGDGAMRVRERLMNLPFCVCLFHS
jgi:hypothetical protein